jgi:hypothetical protein
MIGQIRSRLSYANVAATLALFIALGGSSYAAMEINSRDVENNSLRGIDVRNQALTGLDVRKLTRKDFKGGRLHTAANTEVVQKDATVLGDGTGVAIAACPAGKLVSGGGFEGAEPLTDTPIRDSFPAGINTWLVFVEGGTPGKVFSAYAVCSS